MRCTRRSRSDAGKKMMFRSVTRPPAPVRPPHGRLRERERERAGQRGAFGAHEGADRRRPFLSAVVTLTENDAEMGSTAATMNALTHNSDKTNRAASEHHQNCSDLMWGSNSFQWSRRQSQGRSTATAREKCGKMANRGERNRRRMSRQIGFQYDRQRTDMPSSFTKRRWVGARTGRKSEGKGEREHGSQGCENDNFFPCLPNRAGGRKGRENTGTILVPKPAFLFGTIHK